MNHIHVIGSKEIMHYLKTKEGKVRAIELAMEAIVVIIIFCL